MKTRRRNGFGWEILGSILLLAVRVLADSPVQAVSLANPSVATPVGGNGDSLGSVVSADGRFVLFLSSANDLVPNDDGNRFEDIFLRNRTNDTTTLISVNRTGRGGGNGHSVAPVLSTDGRYVAFVSAASNLVANDTNGFTDVFLRDLQSGTTTLLSVNTSGTGAGNGPSTSPFMSADGRYVAFVSAASDLVSNDSNDATDVFVRDLTTGTTTLVSVRADEITGGNGDSDYPVMTPDGRWVAFTSAATNLVGGVTNTQGEIYVRDLAGGTTLWASTNSAALMPPTTNAFAHRITSFNPVLSADGQFVAFRSYGTAPLLLRHNLQTGRTDLVSSNAAGPVFADDPSGPVMTPDGRFIAFSEATGTNGFSTAVYLWDAQSGASTLVSANLAGTATTDTISDTPALSADGRFVAFLSNATDLTTNGLDGSYQVFLCDTLNGTTRLVSADRNGGISGETGGAIPTISADGHYIAFDSLDGGYVANDNNNVYDVFVRDVTTDTSEIVSRADSTAQSLTANGISSVSGNAVSADGRFVAFVSLADDLTANDANHYQDVFVRDLQTGTNILVSANLTGTATANGFSGNPTISTDGRFVVFVSNAPDVTANKTNRNNDIFLRDLQTGTTTLVSVSVDGTTSGNAESSWPQISDDGRYVAFYSLSKNLVTNDSTGGGEIFWRDIQSGLTVSVTTNGRVNAFSPLLSADGRYVVAPGPSPQILVWDAQTRAKVYSIGSNFFPYPYALSADGRTLIFPLRANAHNAVIAHDLAAGTDRIIGFILPRTDPKARASSNGRFVTFVSAANAPDAPTGTNNVYLYDLQTGTSTLVSFNRDRTGGGNGPSDSPSISADGRFVAYSSDATDLVAGDTNNQPDVFLFDRLTGTNALISANQTGSGPGNDRSTAPSISSDGSTLVFKSIATDLVGGDFNGNQDVFYLRRPSDLLVDSDMDGLEDSWERTHFGDLSHNGSGDSDGDGVSDAMEFKAGTDPMDPRSRFSPQAAVSFGTGQVTIRWEAVPGRSYRVQCKNDLGEANWNDLNDAVRVTGSGAETQDTWAGTITQRFYRVIVVE